MNEYEKHVPIQGTSDLEDKECERCGDSIEFGELCEDCFEIVNSSVTRGGVSRGGSLN